MNDTIDRRTGTPVHLWIVGVLALLWDGFGAYDYVMTRTRGAAYLRDMMSGIDADRMMAYVNAFPIWASIGWGLGVWAGLAGAILLLARHRWAVPAMALSLVGALVGIGYQLVHPADVAAVHQGFNAVVPYLIILGAALLYLYTRAMRANGVLG